jgi:hypothetical protein
MQAVPLHAAYTSVTSQKEKPIFKVDKARSTGMAYQNPLKTQ